MIYIYSAIGFAILLTVIFAGALARSASRKAPSHSGRSLSPKLARDLKARIARDLSKPLSALPPLRGNTAPQTENPSGMPHNRLSLGLLLRVGKALR